MKWTWSSDWRKFFGDNSYPFDLACVEQRDGSENQCSLVRSVAGSQSSILLDLGCGYGRHIAKLAQVGYQVVGADISIDCVRRARSRSGKHKVVAASNEYLPFRDKVFDCVYSLYSSVGYLGTSTSTILAEAYRVTRPGGWLIVDVKHLPRRSLSVGWERVPGGVALRLKSVSNTLVRQRNIVASRQVCGAYGFKIERHSEVSLGKHATSAGWEICGMYGGYEQLPLSRTSQRIIVVACRVS